LGGGGLGGVVLLFLALDRRLALFSFPFSSVFWFLWIFRGIESFGQEEFILHLSDCAFGVGAGLEIFFSCPPGVGQPFFPGFACFFMRFTPWTFRFSYRVSAFLVFPLVFPGAFFQMIACSLFFDSPGIGGSTLPPPWVTLRPSSFC